jgi:amino acid adenylation domain-containing protein/thioester reductase-like protein
MYDFKGNGRTHHERQAFRSAPEDSTHDEILADESQHDLKDRSAPEQGYSRARLIHQLFDEQVQRTPHATAVVSGSMSVSYYELSARANQLARYLRDIGVCVDQTVGVCLERSAEMVVALLGVLKAGGAYVPLDPTYPAERLAHMVSDSAPKVLLTRGDSRAKLPETTARIVALDREWSAIAKRGRRDLDVDAVGVQPSNLIYVIYTSGSTGLPKGAMNEHRAVANRLLWMQREYGITVNDRILQKTPFSFDVSGWEFFWTLLNGATLVMARPDGHKDPAYLKQIIDELGVTCLHFVPSMLSSFLTQVCAGDCLSLKQVVCSGEELPASLQSKVFERLPSVKLSNLYGPTEAAIDVTSWECRQDDVGGRVPIGHPITNVDIYVLNQDLQRVPVEVPGEIYIGGAGVGRGYMNRPALTAERFLVDPFSSDCTARMYRTGDLGRVRPDGAIDYLGRNDFQVKIRGFRIELGEIEAHLLRHPEVREAAVLVREDVPGDKRIVAYLIPEGSGLTFPAVDGELEQKLVVALRRQMEVELPSHMVPNAFVVMEQFPLSVNGKLDRRRLPSPGVGAYANTEFEKPQGPLEEVLADVWKELLRMDRVGRTDNFFALGGHSLLIIEMLRKLHGRGVSAEVRDVFSNPILSSLASAVAEKVAKTHSAPANQIPSESAVIAPEMLPLVSLTQEQINQIVRVIPGGARNIQDIYPLAPLQQGLLFHHLMDETYGDTYVLVILLAFSSRARLKQFTSALQRAVDRHDVLRTAILWRQTPTPIQVVQRRAELPIVELVLDPSRQAVEQLRDLTRLEHQRIDLEQAPLMRLQVASDSCGEECYGLLQWHHLIHDHESLEAMLEEVAASMTGEISQRPDPVPYRDHVALALEYERTQSDRDFFHRKFGDVTEPCAPFGLLEARGQFRSVAESQVTVDLELTSRIRLQARKLGVTAAALFHAAWGLVVARTTGRKEAIFGTVLMGRRQVSADARGSLGLFINTLPLRLFLGDRMAQEFVLHAQTELTELLEHELAALPTAVRSSGITTSAPLFTTLINYYHGAPVQGQALANTPGVRILEFKEWTNYPISLSVVDSEITFYLTAQTDERFNSGRVVRYLVTAVSSLVDALEGGPLLPASCLTIMPDTERDLVLKEFNATQAEYLRQHTIHGLFEEQVTRTPTEVAIVFENETLTYTQLNARANQLAHTLRAKGVLGGQLVGICVERSLEMMVGLLGILKAEGAYVPIDPNYPPERVAYMLEDTAPKVLLTQERLRSLFLGTAVQVLSLDTDWGEVELQSAENPNAASPELRSQHLAYVIYTSGSTGRPKGVMVTHRSLGNLVSWHIHAFGLKVGSRTSSSAGVGFDATTWEVWPSLCCGGCLVLAPARASGDPQELLGWWRDQTLDVSFLVTPLAELAYATGRFNAGLSTLLIGGDRLRSWPGLLPDEQRLINNYGPTETTVVATSGQLYKDDAVLHIGKPISNTQVYILDAEMQPIPVGVIGELYIGGAGVAQGYLNRPDLTAERFAADPFGDAEGRLYRTGDLGRWRPDGTIEYLGRNDHQVKIRGFRIELEEIETQLSRHPQVKDAVVLARESARGEMRLVGYVVSRELAPGIEELRGYLKELLPDYMVPGAFVVLESLPLMANGKLDRKALPAPEEGSHERRLYEAPQGEVENILAGIWQELLRVDRVGRQDHFFELGGHSLLIVQMLERLRRVGLSTQVKRVFDSPALVDLAVVLTREVVGNVEVPPNRIPEGCEKITPEMLPLVELDEEHIEKIVRSVPGGAANIQDIYPLAPLQEGILFHHLLDEQKVDPYARSMLLSLASHGKVEELKEALQRVIDRHDVLRTAVYWDELSQPVQVVYRQVSLPVERIELDADRDVLEQLRERMTSQQQRLDLRRAPLMKLQIATDPHSPRWYGLLQTHHFVFDGQSLNLLLGEVMAYLEGQAERLPRAMPYREHVAQALECVKRHNAEVFFRAKLGDVVEPTAPYGLLEAHGDGIQIETAHERFDPAFAQRVRRQARGLGVSAATLFHAAWGLVVAHTSARDDVVYGTVLLGRLLGSAGAQRILGMFINTLPLRLPLRGVTAKELVEITQRELVELLGYEQTSLAAAQRCSGVGGAAPLFTALLNYRHRDSKQEPQLDGSVGIVLLESQGATNYPITLSVDDQGDGFELTAETDRRIDPRRIVGYLSRAMNSLVAALESQLPVRALDLEIVPESERDLLLKQHNTKQILYQQEKPIHGLFEEQVARTPDAVAVEYEGQLLSYIELNARANQLARYLTERGVGPDQLVGICVERGLDMVIGLLGILKAGGAYVPLDPNYPVERLTYILEDADPKVLLTQGPLRQKLPDTRAEKIMFDEGWQEIARQPSGNLDIDISGLKSHHLAYIIYTSGSTGAPKGVMVEHANVVRLFPTTREWFGFTEQDVWTLFHSYAFDFSVWELWGGLLHGGRVVVVPYLTARAPEEFYRLLCERRVTVLNQTPSAFKQLIAAQECNLQYEHALKVVIFGGEALEVPSLRPWVARNGIQSPRLVNMYGITETTVHVTYRELMAADIAVSGPSPIGVRIPDLQTYILDACFRPVPVGVTGELYIGGAGVARGYLNRPELMAERFIADPYSQEAGARLYRTGDLGRWRNDAGIEYLGRNDHQVKIRGYRIELGEIEAQLRGHHQVKDAVVIARADQSDEKRLVAYVVLHSNGSEEGPSMAKSLRAHLKNVLPEYMVPSALVMLDRIPLTTNGKLDRQSLPVPDLNAYSSRQYQAPQGEMEERLAQIWQELLRVDRIGRHDSFFELGGHSLLALRAIYKVNQVFGSALTGADLYKNSTLTELMSRINRGELVEEFVDLEKEATLDQQIVPCAPVCDACPKTVLVTGATGFVGRFLVTQLLQNTDATVVCLVRAPSSRHALTRLKETLCHWKLWSDRFESRLVAIAADLRQPRMGIAEQPYLTLCSQVDSIYDCATSMNHLETYAMAKASNVESAREIVKMAAQGKSKLINYISTLSVFRPSNVETQRIVNERTVIDHEKHATTSGYTASKWVAEKTFAIALERGFRCNIFRLGLVWADTLLGRYDELQREHRLFQSCLQSGYGISDYDYDVAPVPVDFVARAVVALAERYSEGSGIFHISSSRAVRGIFERSNLTAGTDLELLPLYQWLRVVRRLHESGSLLPVVPLIENLFSLDEAALRQYQLLGNQDVRVDCERTSRELENLGILPRAWDDGLLIRFIENLRDRHPELRERPLRARADIVQRHYA